jgi:glutamate synthase (NADPH) small chain
MKQITPKERMKIPRQHMPEQDAVLRRGTFSEVNLGLDMDLACREALRCLQCSKPKCVDACPVGMKIKEFILLIAEGEFLKAAAIVRQDNSLPAITGRVCPQEEQCEGVCVLTKKLAPVAIGYLERFVADYERRMGDVAIPARAPSTGKSVAIVGSGPAGLSAAGDLVQKGHEVTVFEALHEIGGVLVYGIPEFRLPKEIVRQEVETLGEMGVRFEKNIVVGQTLTIDELFEEEGFDAVFVATGAGLPQFMKIPGEQLNGVYSANEFLTRVNLMKSYSFPEYDQPVHDCRGKRVVVIGGGNTALDAVRTAVRLGASEAWLVYRRSEAEMPARVEEIAHARQEGIHFVMLTAPLEFADDGKGWLKAVRCQKMALGEPDSSGRRRPVPIEGSEYWIAAELAVIAIGTGANPLIQASTPDLATNRWGYIEADPDTLRTSKRAVWAGGDIVTGAATVILAMGAGRRAARSIDDYLNNGEW